MPALIEQPVLFDDLKYHWDVFWELSETRSSGFNGAEPIKYTEILAYMEAHKITSDTERQRLMQRVRFLDRTLFEYRSAQEKKKTAATPKK